MLRQAFDSSVIASVDYKPELHMLEIEFVHGGEYRYYGVPVQTFMELMAAESHGQFFNANIRDKYRYNRVAAALGHGDKTVAGRRIPGHRYSDGEWAD